MKKIKSIIIPIFLTFLLICLASCSILDMLLGKGYKVNYETFGKGETVETLEMVTALPEELPVLSEKGYEFAGWFYDDMFMIKAYPGDKIVDDITLYAQWNRLKFNIKFEMNGYGSIINDANNVDKIPSLPIPTEPGYKFINWYYDKEFTKQASAGEEIFENITLYANWERIFTIKFETNGHGTQISDIVDVKSLKDLPVPTEEGYEFKGWYYDEGLTLLVSENDEIKDDLVLYAKWEFITYTITFDNNGYGNPIDKVKDVIIPKLPTLTEEGYIFKGWYLDKELITPAIENSVIKDDVILYAKWEQAKYTISFNNNGIGTKPNSIHDLIEVPELPILEQTGKIFIGWYYDQEFNNLVNIHDKLTKDILVYAKWEDSKYVLTIEFRNGQENIVRELKYNEPIEKVSTPQKEGSVFVGWFIQSGNEVIEFSFTNAIMPANDLVIFAKYTGESTIVYSSNNVTYKTVSGEAGENIPIISDPVRIGYDFVGWYQEEEFINVFDLSVFPGSDIMVYAKWIANEITIKFNSNGGTGTMANQTYIYDSQAPLNSNLFTRIGYKFLGWSQSSTSTTANYSNGYTQNIVSSGILTLYAVWQKITYNIAYVINGHGTQPASVKGVTALPSKLPILIEEGYLFIGWYYDDDLSKQAKANDVIDSNVILYAKWEQEGVPTPEPTEKIVENIIYDDFQIYFLELGNGNSGDSVYIKAGSVDVLIDAGSKRNSTNTLISHINKYRAAGDDMIDYVIATHAHEDHIAGFVGESNVSNDGILYEYKIGTIIDFAYKNTTSGVSSEYIKVRDDLVSKGTKHYTAAQCFNQENGAKRSYELADGITMEILYNYYYFNKTSDENDYSVCTLFTYKDHNFIFTGDLEESGEQKLAAYYDGSSESKTLPQVEVFKAGHHGSKTSSNDCLLSKIQPEIVCVCCCAGGSEYTKYYQNTFPTQEMIDRVAKYTDRVYATTAFNISKLTYESLNGIITISSNGTNIGISATNNIKKLKDSTWFNTTIYADSNGIYCSSSTKYYTSSTSGVTARPQRVWPS